MLRNYLLTAWKVFMRRKLFTTINLACIVLTLVVLMVITALLETTFWPTGVEGKSERFLQVYSMCSMSADSKTIRTGPPGFKTIDKYLKSMPGVERVSAFTTPDTVSVYQGDRVSELQMRRVDADYWKILDFKVLAGRLPDEGDEIADRLVAVVNASTSRKLFGGQPFRVIGVVEDVIHFNAYADMWAPLSTFPSSDYQNQLMGSFAAMLLARDKADLPRIQ
jgi:putative ABC transport system permease protein